MFAIVQSLCNPSLNYVNLILYGISNSEIPIARTLFSLNADFCTMLYYKLHFIHSVPAVAQWLRRCATNRKVAGSIPAGVIGFFIGIKSFQSHCGPGVDSASNKNEYQEYFLGVKAAGA
jgi:hypothetical protein